MSRSTGALALAIVLLVCLLATAPARLLSMVVPPEQVFAQGFSGTLWRGSANRCLVRTAAGYLHLGAVSWNLNPFSLLLFSPRLSLESSWGSQTLVTDLVLRGSEDFDLSDFEANIPADLLRQFVPIKLAGMLSVQLNELQIRSGLPDGGSGRAVWKKGAWNAPGGPVQLGSYALDFTQEQGAPLLADVVTLSGRINAQGLIQLQGRSYDIDVALSSETAFDQRLEQALSLVAQSEGQGFRIKLDGEF